MSDSVKNALEWGFKILSVFLIPVIVYLFNMSTNIKLMEQRAETQTRTIEKLEGKIERIEEDLNQVQLNSQELRQMRTDLNQQNAMMREVYQWVLRQQGRNP
jgi:predicted Holliday junction resolvase-like endonuclease|tara:strand:+ start:260 stop:565 length:306 start_codon:yes stop_codon:yes gene_type:complete